MKNLSLPHQIMIGSLLLLMFIVTRGQHVPTLQHWPSASLAVFFLAGVYLRVWWVFPALFALGWGLDYYQITYAGVSNYCYTIAYGFLVPAYASLWLAGRWYRGVHHFKLDTLIVLFAAVLLSTMLSELFSSGGFYFFSGRFVDTSWAGFFPRFERYYPNTLQNTATYIALAALVHALIGLALQQSIKLKRLPS